MHRSLYLQIEELLLAQYGSGFKFDPYIVVACMLVQEGADPHIKNLIGQNPLQKCPPDLASVVRMFAQERGSVSVLELLVFCAQSLCGILHVDLYMYMYMYIL